MTPEQEARANIDAAQAIARGEKWTCERARQLEQARLSGRENPAQVIPARTARAVDLLDAAARINGRDPWPTPTPLPAGVPPVQPFDLELLPPVLRQAVADISDRMQCPPDFPAVSTMVMLSSVVGRRRAIKPKREDDWTVVPNLWGMIIGRPGIMKSPPLTEVMRPLQALETDARTEYERAMLEYEASRLVAEQHKKVEQEAIRKELKKGDRKAASERALDATKQGDAEPVRRRYIVNDPTVEKLGELLNQNPHGLLFHRDELTGFFRTLERQGHEADRAFYLECWNGDGSFTYDRIGRGTLHIAGACLSIIGSIQPAPLAELVRGLRGAGDDGLLQRFQLAVWPDTGNTWRNIDRAPDRAAREQVKALIKRLDSMPLDPLADEIPALRFDEKAQALFDTWRESLEVRLRTGNAHPMLEAHLAKYRSLVPSLALILHLADNEGGRVELLSLEMAIAWAEYLETHAQRIYAPAVSPDMDAARALAGRIRAGDVPETFALRDIYRNGWTSLSEIESAAGATKVLEEFDWLRCHQEPTQGRTRTYYRLNPLLASGSMQ